MTTLLLFEVGTYFLHFADKYKHMRETRKIEAGECIASVDVYLKRINYF